MIARKRKRGPAKGTGGRPRKPVADLHSHSLTVALRQVDTARLARLREALTPAGGALVSEAEIVRQALEVLEHVSATDELP